MSTQRPVRRLRPEAMFVFSLSLLVVMTSIVMLTGCTQNQRAKSFGGTAKVELPPCQKLIEATWKEEHLWYLSRPMRDGEPAETYNFKENSSFGMMEGTVVFVESRDANCPL